MKLLLISNSTMAGEPYLHYATPYIDKFLGSESLNILFIPFAAVTMPYEEYEKKVNTAFQKIGRKVISIHHVYDLKKEINKAECIVVGGGNTWELLFKLQSYELVELIRKKIQNGVPYIGWSAGANIACPTIKTTNDMPIIEPKSMDALALIPFQINPHFLDKKPEGHGGESREDRINEFIEVNRNIFVVGLREGSMVKIENGKIQLMGYKACRIFHYKKHPAEINTGTDLQFLIH